MLNQKFFRTTGEPISPDKAMFQDTFTASILFPPLNVLQMNEQRVLTSCHPLHRVTTNFLLGDAIEQCPVDPSLDKAGSYYQIFHGGLWLSQTISYQQSMSWNQPLSNLFARPGMMTLHRHRRPVLRVGALFGVIQSQKHWGHVPKTSKNQGLTASPWNGLFWKGHQLGSEFWILLERAKNLDLIQLKQQQGHVILFIYLTLGTRTEADDNLSPADIQAQTDYLASQLVSVPCWACFWDLAFHPTHLTRPHLDWKLWRGLGQVSLLWCLWCTCQLGLLSSWSVTFRLTFEESFRTTLGPAFLLGCLKKRKNMSLLLHQKAFVSTKHCRCNWGGPPGTSRGDRTAFFGFEAQEESLLSGAPGDVEAKRKKMQNDWRETPIKSMNTKWIWNPDIECIWMQNANAVPPGCLQSIWHLKQWDVGSWWKLGVQGSGSGGRNWCAILHQPYRDRPGKLTWLHSGLRCSFRTQQWAVGPRRSRGEKVPGMHQLHQGAIWYPHRWNGRDESCECLVWSKSLYQCIPLRRSYSTPFQKAVRWGRNLLR